MSISLIENRVSSIHTTVDMPLEQQRAPVVQTLWADEFDKIPGWVWVAGSIVFVGILAAQDRRK